MWVKNYLWDSEVLHALYPSNYLGKGKGKSDPILI